LVPEITKTRPFGSVVQVGYHRPFAIEPRDVQPVAPGSWAVSAFRSMSIM
jgi:hypothetical protein